MFRPAGLSLVWFGAISITAICLGILRVHSMPQRLLAQTVEVVLPAERSHRQQDEVARPADLKMRLEQARSRTSWTDPTRVAGHEKCVDCHQPEIKTWLASKHSSRAFDLLRTTDTALEYASKLQIQPADIAKSSICVNCHGTPQVQLDGSLGIIPGVSCEACHNGSGGHDGWLNPHAVYGFAGTFREQESPQHFAMRAQRSQEAGQLRSTNLYGLTKRCFQCHVVGDEALSIAGHDHGEGFEMVAKSLGEVRHNFLLNENENAKIATLWTDSFRHGGQRTVAGRLRVMFVLGQMIDLEVSLRNLARATAENDFSDTMIGRIEAAYETLADDILKEVANASLPADRQPELAEIEAVVEIVEPVWEGLDDDGFDTRTRHQYETAANAIAAIAKTFAQRDGNQLAYLDELDLLPEDFFEGAYLPNAK